MKVFIIESGEENEGSGIVGVYSNKDKAIEEAEKEVERFVGRQNKKKYIRRHKKSELEKGCVAYWNILIDFVSVTEWEVTK